MSENILEMRKITKRFGDFTANDAIDFDLKAGEIHALLGENGAGKSTLMSMLAGLIQPSSGDIFLKGQAVIIDSPKASQALGIGMVYQHFMLIDQFTVAENIMLGQELTQGLGYLDMDSINEAIQTLSHKYQLPVNGDDLVADISVGQQQRVEILKTLYRGADIIIFDEPTAVLTPQEIDQLMITMADLKAAGKSIIFISHKLDEIMKVADRITVIRRGQKIATLDRSQVDADSLAELMIGRSVNFHVQADRQDVGEPVLQVKDLHVKDNRKLPAVKDVNLTIHAGEIVGLAGIEGNGQTELVEAITGLRRVDQGDFYLKGQSLKSASVRQLLAHKLSHIPEDRHQRGLQLSLSVADNMIMQTYYQTPFSHKGIFNFDAINQYANDLVKKFDIRTPGIDSLAGELSGGNQQKIVIARELDRQPDFLVAAQPTRGLDVGAIEYVHQGLLDQAQAGTAILLVSSELDEILDLADRIAVMYDGRLIKVVNRDQVDKRDLGLLMIGQEPSQLSKEDMKHA
ncbi:heme ABC transporter ATP-binding protein [Aerococcus urinaehominis]|uniref:Heme ABC transporter ATP-binding protein n=1 Tax=Aerococcus urinaehominis TaxID=128944 RepID=A0A0X8FMG8_9LACT|nr:ABC transporter ATP-binding protein [Aerococcus urinaehominis]AMC00019.1 heme ABC transporter ATP-binding protein [Aerococcus urinaehominis]